MFGSVKFGGIMLRNVVGNVVRNSDVKLSGFESSSSLKKNTGSGRKTEDNLKAGRHQKRKRVREEFSEEEPVQKKFGQGKNNVGELNLGEINFKKEKASAKTELKGVIL